MTMAANLNVMPSFGFAGLASGRPLAASSRQFVQTYVDEDELLRVESGVV
jgi:hypothetical protein